ncbi:MAG: CsgG/HfaB family protein [Holophagaceae bacterium]
MKIRNLILAAAALLAFAVPASAQVEKSKRPRVAVLEFPAAKNAYEGWHWWGDSHVSETKTASVIQDLFVTELSEAGSGKIRLIDREALEKIRAEINFGQSGEVDPATAVKVGKLLGVKYMVTGKITRFAMKKGGFSTGWLTGLGVARVTGNAALGAVAGDVKVGKTEFSGRLDARVIDVETGEIIGAVGDDSKVSNVGVKVAGTGGEVQYDQTMVSQVFEPIVKAMAPKLVSKIMADQ